MIGCSFWGIPPKKFSAKIFFPPAIVPWGVVCRLSLFSIKLQVLYPVYIQVTMNTVQTVGNTQNRRGPAKGRSNLDILEVTSVYTLYSYLFGRGEAFFSVIFGKIWGNNFEYVGKFLTFFLFFTPMGGYK